MTDEEFKALIKIKFEETVESIKSFTECVLDKNNCNHTESEIELANHLRLSVMFYKIREEQNNEESKRVNINDVV